MTVCEFHPDREAVDSLLEKANYRRITPYEHDRRGQMTNLPVCQECFDRFTGLRYECQYCGVLVWKNSKKAISHHKPHDPKCPRAEHIEEEINAS